MPPAASAPGSAIAERCGSPERKKYATRCTGKPSYVYIYIADVSEFCFGWNFIACT
jgi:hypothetical protein